MAKTITIPTNVGYARSRFALNRTIAMAASPFSGKQLTQEFDAAFWTATLTLPPMSRSQAALWQSFFLNLEGPKNNFLLVDPDAKEPLGTYSADWLTGEVRVNSGVQVNGVTLSFASNGTITAGSSIFDGLVVGDFITVSGATNEDNNGTFKITTKTSNTVVITDGSFITEGSTQSCKVRQNIKGSTGLSLQAKSNATSGTIKAGTYLAVYDGGAVDQDTPIQLVMVTEDATATVNSGKDHYAVRIQPKLRADLGTNAVGISATYNKSRFRLTDSVAEWDADQASRYGITFDCIEVL